MRFDLTVNEFTKDLALGKELVIFGEQFWRPYCHVKDFSNAFITVLNSPKEKLHITFLMLVIQKKIIQNKC
jgi:nucleoside-diphosphate-sugar epimerase